MGAAQMLSMWILGQYVLVVTDSVFLLAVFGSLQFGSTLLSPYFGTLADRIDLVVPRHSVDAADFQAAGDGDLLERIDLLAREGRVGSALALCRQAAFDAFRTGDAS